MMMHQLERTRSFPRIVRYEDMSDNEELSLIEAKCGIGARANFGRSTLTALENKCNFMNYLNKSCDKIFDISEEF